MAEAIRVLEEKIQKKRYTRKTKWENKMGKSSMQKSGLEK